MQVEELINQLELKFQSIDDKITKLLEDNNKNKRLLTQIDFIQALGITVPEYDLLQDYNNIDELKESDIKRLIKLNDLLEQKYKYIDLINEKIILTVSNWRVVNKNSITYILNKNKYKQDKQNVIINVYVDKNNKQNITTKTLLKNGIKDINGGGNE